MSGRESGKSVWERVWEVTAAIEGAREPNVKTRLEPHVVTYMGKYPGGLLHVL